MNRVCHDIDRSPDEVDIIAVTKGFPTWKIRAIREFGLTDVGENRIQRALEKKDELGDEVASPQWHMIGHVQSNKVKYLLGEFDLIHSVDRKSLIDELEKRLGQADREQSVLLQVNVSGEESKYGADPENASRVLEMILRTDCLSVEGLMTMAPRTDQESVLRETFSGCRDLRDELARDFDVRLPELSMGMTNDYPEALREGSTMLRLGRALFGERPK